MNTQVVRPEGGEVLLDGMIVLKATAATGTSGAEMMIATMAPGTSTSLHMHTHSEEFFFVPSGTGSVILGECEFSIGPGDTFFIPKECLHQLKNTDLTAPLKLVAFLDKPGLAEDFRQMHREMR